MVNENEEALKNFILDIQCLDSLSKWSNQFNIFDVLKITGAEIRHSNMLAWLLDPKENHGLGDSFLCAIIRKLISDGAQIADAFSALLMDFDDFEIRREWQHIDILAISHTQKFYLCIENKIHSGEHDDQLSRYRATLSKEYPEYAAMFAYLTPDGELPEKDDDRKIWQGFSYQSILTILEQLIAEKSPPTDVQLLLSHYTETLRRHIVENKELNQLCNKIYTKHKKALDLIYENRFDTATQISEVIHSWCQEQDGKSILYAPANSGKTYTRFTTPNMDAMLPKFQEPISGWNSDSMYYYEIELRQKDAAYMIRTKVTVCSKNLSSAQWECCNKICTASGTAGKKSDWTWKTIHSFREDCCTIEEDIVSDESRNKIRNALDATLEKIVKFEKDLKNKLQ